MSRRYLLTDEVDAALRRGKTVEAFLGSCNRAGERGIRRLAIASRGASIETRIYETADYGGPDSLDLYAFGPLDPDLELGEADETLSFPDLGSCLSALSERFPGVQARLVNEGMIQDEYADFISRGRNSA
jgi:hypothetical protein